MLGERAAIRLMGVTKIDTPFDMYKVDKDFFLNELSILGWSQRKFAKQLKMNPTSLVHALRGERRFALTEVVEIAELFHKPVEVIMEAAGMNLDRTVGKSSKTVPISGWIDGKFQIHMEAPRHGPKVAPVPEFAGTSVAVVRFQTPGTALESLDGALVYFSPSQGAIEGSIGRLSVISVAGPGGEVRLGVLKRGYGSGSFNLTAMNGELLASGISVKNASPVVWMKL